MKRNGVDNSGIVMKFYRIERFCYLHHLKIVSKIIFRIIYLLFNCYIPPSCSLGRDVKIAHGIGIVIHQRAIIGSGTKIYQNATIGGSNEIFIGENCLIGANSTIVGNVHIGNNAKIGANTFVDFDVPEGVTVVGYKGRIIERE